MPYLNTIGGGSARKFGFTRRTQFYKCLTDTSIVTLNLSTLQCLYPPNYAATPFQYQANVRACHNGGGPWGTDPSTFDSCCSCAPCPFPNCQGCFGLSCTCYDYSWNPIGNVSGGCYEPFYALVTLTGYACPTNSPPAALSGTTCVYPATYSATLVDG